MAFMDYTPVGALKNWMFTNPADKASNYLDQIPDTLRPYFEPYIKSGQSVIPSLQNQYGNLVNDPSAFLKKIGSGYQESPGYKFSRDQSLNAINNAAGAGGMLGTAQHQQEAGETATNLANQDFYGYLSNALKSYFSGLQGQQGLYDTGARTSSNFGEDLAQALMSKANLAYSGQQNQNQSRSGLVQSLAGLAGGFF